MKNFVLVGMPAVGKSTIGVLLAKSLLLSFTDTDLLIQGKYKKSLCDIIKDNGTKAFLDIEENIILEAEFKNSVIATGGSAVDAIDLLKEKGVKKIKFLCIIAAPEGLKKVKKMHPDVTIYCAHIDDKLNEHKYICPGLGDAGDRIFGTK